MASNFVTASPFTANVLAGWEPVHPHIRYPVTMSLHREGANHMLFLAPMNLSLLQSLLPVDAADQALVVTSESGGIEGRVQQRRWSTIGQIDTEADIIHLPRHTTLQTTDIEQIGPLLLAPNHAVPEQWGSRLAIGFNDHCHTTIITPNRNIIQEALVGFISAYIQTVVGLSVPTPEVPTHLQEALLAPMLPGEWTEIRFRQQQRYWTLRFAHQSNDCDSTLWVAPANEGYWRDGWSW